MTGNPGLITPFATECGFTFQDSFTCNSFADSSNDGRQQVQYALNPFQAKAKLLSCPCSKEGRVQVGRGLLPENENSFSRETISRRHVLHGLACIVT